MNQMFWEKEGKKMARTVPLGNGVNTCVRDVIHVGTMPWRTKREFHEIWVPWGTTVADILKGTQIEEMPCNFAIMKSWGLF